MATRNSSPSGKRPGIGLAACTFQIAAAAGEVQLVPAGVFRATDGRPHDAPHWYIDDAIARQVIARAAARSNRKVIDYEHQTLYAEANGQPAPAAGWFRMLEWRPNVGLFAVDVEWTAKAKAAIEAGEYLYISPVFSYDKRSGEVGDVVMAALTNYAGIDGMAEAANLAAAKFLFEPQEDEFMKREQLIKMLGLNDDASDADIEQAMAALKANADQVSTLQTEMAALKQQVDQQAVGGADAGGGDNAGQGAQDGEPDPAKYAPMSMVNEMQTTIVALSARITEAEIGELVDAALEDGRLLKAQEQWARDLGKKDVAALKSFLESAQPIAALKGSQTNGQPPGGEGDGELNAQELAVCKATGVDPEEYKKNKTTAA